MTDTNGVTFGQLNSDGTLSHVRVIRQSDIGRCPFVILVPDHNRGLLDSGLDR